MLRGRPETPRRSITHVETESMTPMQDDFKALRHSCHTAIVPLVLAAALLMSAPGRRGDQKPRDPRLRFIHRPLHDTRSRYARVDAGAIPRPRQRPPVPHRRRRRPDLNNLFRFGNQTIDEHLDAEGSVSPLKIHGSRSQERASTGDTSRKGSDYEFGNDYTQANAMLRVRSGCRRVFPSELQEQNRGDRLPGEDRFRL